MNAIQLDGARKTRKKEEEKQQHIIAIIVIVVVFAVNVRRVCVNDDDAVDKLLKENLYKWK